MSWKWKTENRWHVTTALKREAALGKAEPPKKERLQIWTFSAPGKVGRNYEVQNAVQIEASFAYNGGLPESFGGAKKWPLVLANIPFQEGQIAERDAFVAKLKKFLEENL